MNTIGSLTILAALLAEVSAATGGECATSSPVAKAAPIGVHAREKGAPGDAKAIIALELELTDLLARGAFDEYASHLAPGYVLTTEQGQVLTRSEALAGWRARGPGDRMTPSEMHVRVYGDTAILSARVVGTDSSTPDRITKTFVRINGKWMLAALHVSQIAQRQK
jgi:hypothetical protein